MSSNNEKRLADLEELVMSMAGKLDMVREALGGEYGPPDRDINMEDIRDVFDEEAGEYDSALLWIYFGWRVGRKLPMPSEEEDQNDVKRMAILDAFIEEWNRFMKSMREENEPTRAAVTWLEDHRNALRAAKEKKTDGQKDPPCNR